MMTSGWPWSVRTRFAGRSDETEGVRGSKAPSPLTRA